MTSLLQPRVRYLRVGDGSRGGRGAVNRGRVLPVRYRRVFHILHLFVNVTAARRSVSSFDHRQRWVERQGARQHLSGKRHP